ncbi:MAG: hypothetical protein Q4B70_18815, partial [Lachnospiraceae bacterium]|nr:hypothetical protein [Lachnospiraceae bacterium]
MFAIPMDPKSSDIDLNSEIPISITKFIETSTSKTHPLQIRANRLLSRSYIAGRNIVITSGESPDDHLVFITGMGPKYGETEKVKLQEAIGAEVFDIIDVLPGLTSKQKQAMRYIFIDTKYLLELEKLLLQSSISEENADDIKFILENISPQIQHIFNPLKGFIESIDFEETESISSTSFIAHKKLLEDFLEKQKITTKQVCSDLLQGLLKIVEAHLGATLRQKTVALESLSKMKDMLSTKELYYREFIMQITSLEPLVLSSSLAGLKLVDDEDKNHERALGDLF